MGKVYVHGHNTIGFNSFEFNCHMLVFLSKDFLPWPDRAADSWLRVACFRSQDMHGRTRYLSVNSNFERFGSALIIEEDNLLLTEQKVISSTVVQRIVSEAIDVPAWEEKNGQKWPYHEMFAHVEPPPTRQTLRTASHVSNANAAQIQATIRPRPCRSCGKKSRRRR